MSAISITVGERSTVMDGKFTNVPESATVVAHSVSPLKIFFHY